MGAGGYAAEQQDVRAGLGGGHRSILQRMGGGGGLRCYPVGAMGRRC